MEVPVSSSSLTFLDSAAAAAAAGLALLLALAFAFALALVLALAPPFLDGLPSYESGSGERWMERRGRTVERTDVTVDGREQQTA